MISTWAVKFNVGIKSAEVSSGSVYRIKDIFTTRNGSWEPSAAEGSIEPWARGTYIRSFNSPHYFDDGGGDHHLFGGIYDPVVGQMVKTGGIHYWTWTDNNNHVVQPVKTKSGWANNLLFNSYNPDLDMDNGTGERGAWAWTIDSAIPADIVLGGGLPFNWHVSFFATWTLENAVIIPDTDDIGERMDKFETWAVDWSHNHPGGPIYVI